MSKHHYPLPPFPLPKLTATTISLSHNDPHDSSHNQQTTPSKSLNSLQQNLHSALPHLLPPPKQTRHITQHP